MIVMIANDDSIGCNTCVMVMLCIFNVGCTQGRDIMHYGKAIHLVIPLRKPVCCLNSSSAIMWNLANYGYIISWHTLLIMNAVMVMVAMVAVVMVPGGTKLRMVVISVVMRTCGRMR